MQMRTALVRTVSEHLWEIGAANPQAVALRSGDTELTYSELNSRADEFALHLATLNVLRGDTVAICIERSFAGIIAALGVLRSGAAYVPLDPSLPDARLKFCIQDSRARVLVACRSLSERLGVEIIAIDPLLDSIPDLEAPIASSSPIEMDDLAYVIYTSGSAGNPKGVEITHANLAHLVEWHRRAFLMTTHDRVSHLAGLGFDAAVWEVWGSLAAGSTLCLASDEVRSSPQLIQEWILRERITVGFVPTVHVPALMKMRWPETTELRLLLTGGDVLLQRPPVGLPFDVVNNYGPTECTVVTTSGTVAVGSDEVPSIGCPIDGATIYLLNERGEQVAKGEVGEIYIAGNGVGKGYRNLSEVTELSFLPDPFSRSSDSRMYRSGDRGRLLPDGQIQFLGRIDRQTKIRGQRVELDEISVRLSQHPGLEFATVIGAKSPDGGKYLVAYYKPGKTSGALTIQQLQEYLLDRLPDYMVPGVFILLEKIPISANGKIDLRLLPSPLHAKGGEVTQTVGRVTATELEFLSMIRGLLNGKNLQMEDNFFLAGGHSLLGMQLILQIRKTFNVELTLRQLFEAPTPKRLADLIDNLLKKKVLAKLWVETLEVPEVKYGQNFFELGGTPALAAVLQERISQDFGEAISVVELLAHPTIDLQVKLLHRPAFYEPTLPPGVMALQPLGAHNGIFWVHYLSANLAKVLGDDRPFLHVSLTSDDFGELGEAPTMERIAACFVSKIRATQAEGPYTLGGFCLGGILAYEIAFQLRQAGHEVSHLVLIDPPSPSYLSMRDPLAPRFFQWNYIWKRATRLGIRVTMQRLRERMLKGSKISAQAKLARAEMGQAQDMIQSASFRYKPQSYDGQVLLFLATDRPPHVDFLPGWSALITKNLQSEYIDAHHSVLTQKPSILGIAAAISSLIKA